MYLLQHWRKATTSIFCWLHTLTKSSLCSKINIAYADNLLRLFVQVVAELYDKEDLVYNIYMRGLLHIVADAERFGTLKNFSSFPFENKLKSIKRLVSKPQLPLQQVVWRLLEQERTGSQVKTSISSAAKSYLLHEHCRGPVTVENVGAKQFGQGLCSNMFIASNNPDSCIILADGAIAVVNNWRKMMTSLLFTKSLALPSACSSILLNLIVLEYLRCLIKGFTRLYKIFKHCSEQYDEKDNSHHRKGYNTEVIKIAG